MFEGPLLRGHRPHALEFTFQVTAGGLSEWDLGLQGWGMQQEVLQHGRKWLGQHILQGTGWWECSCGSPERQGFS